MASILMLPLIFGLATGWLYILTSLAPVLEHEVGNVNNTNRESQFSFPSNLDDLKQMGFVLNNYSKSHPIYVFILFVSAYLYKQTFAIPGSVFLNILSGALFGTFWGFPLTCFLTATGATFCYLLSKFCGQHLVVKFFPQKIESFQKKVEENRENLLYFLLFIRLFPMTPNWLINIASPLVNIPIHLFFISVFIGLMPYNFLCVQTGVVLFDLQSMQKIFSFTTLLKLASIAFVALIPALIKKYLNKNLSSTTTFSEGLSKPITFIKRDYNRKQD